MIDKHKLKQKCNNFVTFWLKGNDKWQGNGRTKKHFQKLDAEKNLFMLKNSFAKNRLQLFSIANMSGHTPKKKNAKFLQANYSHQIERTHLGISN